MVRTLRLHVPVNFWLRHFPVVRSLPGGIRYRARRVESLGLSAEMFDENALYTIIDTPAGIHTFADLGCNVGYFTCWLCYQLKDTRLKGLMVDANAEAVEDARWHIQQNNLLDVHALHGLAGLPKEGMKPFFVYNRSNVCSTATPQQDVSADSWTRVQVPCVDVEENWSKRFGDAPCDLLKIDIEGSEREFFQNEQQFMRRVRTILIEWHKRTVGLEEITGLLSVQGFALKKILHQDDILGTAMFIRNN
ncbi:MAG: FkbM family methyltransferase, partial [Limisphaerales bacterium]